MTTYTHYTLRHGRGPLGGIDVLGWTIMPESSVLAGQSVKCFLNNFPDEAAARAAYPQAERFSNAWTDPGPSLGHLPDEDTPAPGGAWPDDIGG